MGIFDKFRIINNTSLQVRFLVRILLPPFLILLIISIVGFVVLDRVLRANATDELRRSAVTTAAKMEREFSLRKSILRSTGDELFNVANSYGSEKIQLKEKAETCKVHLSASNNFQNAPNNACEPFFAQFALALNQKSSLQSAVDVGYVEKSNELTLLEREASRERLETYVEFFPETRQLIVADKEGKVINQASRGQEMTDEYMKSIEAIIKKALNQPIEGEFVKNGDMRLLVFAYPITSGVVLAAYNLDHIEFLYLSWKTAPIDTTRSYIVIADAKSKQSYPKIGEGSLYEPVLGIAQGDAHTFASSNIEYLAVSEPIGNTNWRVIAASPAAIALEPLMSTNIMAVAVSGGLLVVLLWLGSRFVNRTVKSILELASGAIVFANNQLDHRINTSSMSDKEFAQLAEIMNSMAEKIQVAEAAIDQKNKEFISIATHEIKAPMTAIIGHLSMVLDDGMGNIDDTARQLMSEAYKGTVRLRDLVNELLDIARLESGRAQFNIERLDLVSEIKDMIKLQESPAAEKGITLTYRAPTESLPVMADKTKLEVVLTNFISNGIKYNRPQGSVSVAHKLSNNQVVIAISDTGLGIPKDQQAKMFQKFFRVSGEDRASIPGTGLGMYITKQFIEGMGGKLWFESEHSKGTTFYFTLPLADSMAQGAGVSSSPTATPNHQTT